MMPSQQLQKFQNELFGLKTCFALGDSDLDAAPLCPHCQFRPVEEPASAASAGDRLRALDEALDELVRGWTTTLLSNLEDPTVAANIDLLTDTAGKDAIRTFLKARALPEPVGPGFVKALQDVLGGLEKVILAPDDLRQRLTDGGVPCTVSELKERFDAFVGALTKGKDPSKVRIVVE
jgi:hypothetical protein